MSLMQPKVSTAGADGDLVRIVEELKLELSEAHRREASTAEVLKAISRSTFNLQDVLDSLIKSAAELADAETGLISRPDGEVYRVAAIYNPYSPEVIETLKQSPIPSGRKSASGRAVLERRVIHIHDVFDDPEYTWVGIQNAGVRTILAVPMLRENFVVGAILCARRQVRPFTAKQIELVQTFADQAVIAIENTRLFHQTKEALERQTVTAEILKVIASSPSDSQPVFNAIATSANRLLGGLSTAVWRFEGDKCYLAAFTPINATADEALKALSPMRISDSNVMKLPSEGKIVQFRDTEEGPPGIRDLARLRGFRAMLFVPLMNQAVPIGFVSVARKEPDAFDPDDVQLLQTFADQAVIAIENARLFRQVQARTRELTESLEQQTATADVLKVISRSALDVQKVLDALVESAARLCDANDAA